MEDSMLNIAYAFQTNETIKPLLSAKGDASSVIPSLANMNYDAIELLVRNPSEAQLSNVISLIEANHMNIASFSTGPMVADDQLSFTAVDTSIRAEAIHRVHELINWASNLGCSVTIGKLRGQIDLNQVDKSWELMKDSFQQVLDIAEKKSVPILIEPQNSSQMNNLNETVETLTFIDNISSSSLGIMLDNLHLEAESSSTVSTSLLIQEAKKKLKFFHLTDSERLIPGEGTYNLGEVLSALKTVDPSPIVSFEIKQQDDQLQTAYQAISHVRSLL